MINGFTVSNPVVWIMQSLQKQQPDRYLPPVE